MLTEGGAHAWAICHPCDRRGGRSLRSGWFVVFGWIALPILGLAIAVALLAWFLSSRS